MRLTLPYSYVADGVRGGPLDSVLDVKRTATRAAVAAVAAAAAGANKLRMRCIPREQDNAELHYQRISIFLDPPSPSPSPPINFVDSKFPTDA